ncbi:endonuclease domain-containing protein (plasmid) [Kitasatospora sp. NBC_00374]|uniref:endonuclease domain-containing protein n=1 Tax=Kitasatospora sp. NBC_00374 TaxID=2975964 RepID=UPI0030DED5FC
MRGLFCSKTCSGLAQRNRVARTCLQCGTGFEMKASRAEQGKGRYCSVDCQALAEGSVYRPCRGCGKTFRVVRSVAERGWGSFCSQACTARRVERSCRVCGKGFSVKASVADDGRGFYCSNTCRHIGHRNRVELTCPVCSQRFTVPASLQDKRRTCSRACWVKIMGADPDMSAILAKARHDLLTTRSETRPERILYALIAEVLAELAPEVGWERQHLLLGRWTVDAAVPSLDLVLQADGDYWHGLLPESREDPRVIGNLANDARQDRALAEKGWTVLRFWESDLIGDLPACEARLRTAVLQRVRVGEPARPPEHDRGEEQQSSG